MNGIIHHCSHPNDADVNFRISEEEIYKAVFNYVEVSICLTAMHNRAGDYSMKTVTR